MERKKMKKSTIILLATTITLIPTFIIISVNYSIKTAVGGCVALLFFELIALALYGKNDNKDTLIASFIDSLSVEDFDFNVSCHNGSFAVSDNSQLPLSERIYSDGKVKTTNGDIVYRFRIPTTCLYGDLGNQYRGYQNIPPCPDSKTIEVSEKVYQDYRKQIEGFDLVDFEVYVLTAELKRNEKVRRFCSNSMSRIIDKATNYRTAERNAFIEKESQNIWRLTETRFIAERFNILNLITGEKAYSEDDYEKFIELVKEYLRGL